MKNYEWEHLSDYDLLARLVDAGVPNDKATLMVLRRFRLQMKPAIEEWMKRYEQDQHLRQTSEG